MYFAEYASMNVFQLFIFKKISSKKDSLFLFFIDFVGVCT